VAAAQRDESGSGCGASRIELNGTANRPGATQSGYHLPGVWEYIFAQEMAMDGTVDPRYLFLMNEGEVPPPPADRNRVWSKILPDMLKGNPSVISASRLGGPKMPVPVNVSPLNDRRGIRAYRITMDAIVTAGTVEDIQPIQPSAPTHQPRRVARKRLAVTV
jgi:hypothetical protein